MEYADQDRRTIARAVSAPTCAEALSMMGVITAVAIDHDANPEHLLEQRRARQTLDAILAAVTLDLRAAFVLFEIEGLSQPEIAEALGVPLGTVASRLRRAREEFTRVAVRRGVLPNDVRRRE